MLLQHGMQNFERAALANLCPEKAEEARALIPSLFTVDVSKSVLLSTDL